MPSLGTNIANLAQRVSNESKALRTLVNGNALDNSALLTTAKNNLVAAINELKDGLDDLSSGAAGIDDGTTSTASTWSSQKTSDSITAAVATIVIPELTDLIDDVTASTSTVYSSSKTETVVSDAVSAAVSNLLDGAPAALDTLNELAAAVNDDATFSAIVTTALGNRVRTDTATQGLDSTQQSNARTNIGAAAASDLAALSAAVGDTDPDPTFVEIFEAGLS
ncbi:hypothetical protein [Pseudonocardia sp. N23]|uniref:hypothetical protein n=1 Tax=Pseudonocardia sp. N23 TaxID=1987376 RepID=UPI000BFCFDA3|nr:hypothetical protein [Pseudonocardia sp. N23]GAY12021.1 hypothetical protein TOK_0411 [Pseudonocardia sp. N23]